MSWLLAVGKLLCVFVVTPAALWLTIYFYTGAVLAAIRHDRERKS